MASAPVLLRDHRGRSLRYNASRGLVFGAEGDQFYISPLGQHAVCLQHESGRWLALLGGVLALADAPVALEFYINPERRERVGNFVALMHPTHPMPA